jgi:glutamate carboxypeptidase
LNKIRTFLEAVYPNFLADLTALVNIDCGTENKPGVDWVGRWVASRCQEWGWHVEQIPLVEYGDCWVARLAGTGQGKVMLSGHLDTVYPVGTAAVRPLRQEGNILRGPGACDMKGGLLVGMYALRALQQTGFLDFAELIFFFNSDEEIGSPASAPYYEQVARQCDAALVFESARANGDIVSARKGSGEYKLVVRGKAAHAGVEPEKGANAILELAHQLPHIYAVNGVAPGVTVNPDVIGGGTKSNVIAAEAWALIDVRAVDPAGAEVVHQALQAAIQPVKIPGTTVELQGDFHFHPMAKTPAVALLAELALAAAHEVGIQTKDVATGGASDANTIASFGVPVIDGLGPVGGLDHGPQEYIEADSIVPRTAMAAGLIQRVLAQRAE